MRILMNIALWMLAAGLTSCSPSEAQSDLVERSIRAIEQADARFIGATRMYTGPELAERMRKRLAGIKHNKGRDDEMILLLRLTQERGPMVGVAPVQYMVMSGGKRIPILNWLAGQVEFSEAHRARARELGIELSEIQGKRYKIQEK